MTSSEMITIPSNSVDLLSRNSCYNKHTHEASYSTSSDDNDWTMKWSTNNNITSKNFKT